MNKIFFIMAMCILPFILFATTWTVGASGCDFTTIQLAIDNGSVVSGDIINVENGTYDAITIGNKGLTIQAADGDTLVYIDGTGEYHCIEFTAACSTATNIKGLIIQNGNANGSGDDADGGGIFNDYVRTIYIDNCTITNNDASDEGGGLYFSYTICYFIDCNIEYNEADYGGGFYFYSNSTSEFSNCNISNNEARFEGGGTLSNVEGSFDDCFITNNYANNANGGILVTQTDCDFTDCVINSNECDNFSCGGICLTSSTSTLIRCTINSNTSSAFAGGIYIYDSDIELNSVQICSNYAYESGGGIYSIDSNITTFGSEGILITDNFAYNHGGAVFLSKTNYDSDYDLNNITVFNNMTSNNGGGIYISGTGSGNFDLDIKNSIIWGNSGDEITSGYDVTYSCIDGGYTGTGNINDEPEFVYAGSDYHLAWNSPCIDAGDPSDDEDDDGTVCDMGYYTADEHENKVYNNTYWYWEGFPRLNVADDDNDGDYVDGIDLFEKLEYPDNPDSMVISWLNNHFLEGSWNSGTESYDWTPSTCDTTICSTRGFKTKVWGSEGGYSTLRIFGELIDPSTPVPVNVVDTTYTWVCYFLEESQDLEDAFDSATLDSLTSIKTQTWMQVNIGGNWYGSGGTLNYKDLVQLEYDNTEENFSFTWQQPTRGGVEPYTRPLAEHFIFTDEPDYYPVFMQFGEDIPDEVAVYVNGVCKGAEVVDDPERFMLRSYVLSEPSGNELEIRFYNKGKEYPVDYDITNIDQDYRPGKLTTGYLEDYAFISFGTPSEEAPPVDTELKTYPNPFNPSVTISCNITEESDVDLAVYNIKGQKVKTLISNEHYQSGTHLENIWNGENDNGRTVSGGVYMIRLKTGYDTQTKKVILLK